MDFRPLPSGDFTFYVSGLDLVVSLDAKTARTTLQPACRQRQRCLILVDWSGQKSPVWDSHCTQNMRFRRMRTGISFTVSLDDRLRLQAIVAAPRSLQKHVWRARIILLSDDGLGTMAIRAATGKSKTCIWRWQARFMTEGVDGLPRQDPPARCRACPG